MNLAKYHFFLVGGNVLQGIPSFNAIVHKFYIQVISLTKKSDSVFERRNAKAWNLHSHNKPPRILVTG